MPKTEYSGIIGNLYATLKKPCGCKNQDDFLILLGQNETETKAIEPHLKARFFKYDCYDIPLDLIKEKNYLDDFRKRVDPLLKNQSIDLDSLNRTLISNFMAYSEKYLDPNTPRGGKNITPDRFIKYNTSEKEKLISYFSVKSDNYDLVYNIYLILYFGVFKTLPDYFFYGTLYQQYLDEFNKKVTSKYGATTVPGIRAIISLANRADPNVIALYEYGEMYYYGHRCGIKQDLERAYDIYEIAAGIDLTDNMPRTKKAVCNPLALWIIAYILLNYHKKGSDLEDRESVPKVDILNTETRIRRAIIYAQASYRFVNNAPASNLLGKIILAIDGDYPELSYLKDEYNLESYEFYIRQAADLDYVYSINNLALIEMEYIFTDPDNKDQHLNEYIKCLKRSADQSEPWACNTLGELYRTGTIHRRSNINGGRTGETLVIPDLIDRDLAYDYYKKATTDFVEVNSAWAYANMLIYYPDKFIGDKKTIEYYVEEIERIGNKSALKTLAENIPAEYGITVELK